jgi:cyclase
MLKVRLIPVLLLKKGRMVKPIKFGEVGERDVGWPATTAQIYDSQDADELVFLDIEAGKQGRRFLLETLEKVAEKCFVPMTAGGGVVALEDFRDLLKAGADKVSINTAAVERPELIREAAGKFGSQCVVVSIDVRETAPGQYEVFTFRGKNPTGLEVVAWAKKVAELGAGEILLTSIDKEGAMAGYDLALIRKVADAVKIPVIANGGAGTRQHFVDAVNVGGASAVAASSVFHFSDSNLTQVKAYIYNAKVAIRPI